MMQTAPNPTMRILICPECGAIRHGYLYPIDLKDDTAETIDFRIIAVEPKD